MIIISKSYIEIQSAKGVKNPIASRIEVNSEKIYWNIRFNIPLNPETVNEESMDVTDYEGYILTSDISYNSENNAIVISPREPYKPNSTYILNISSNVRSKGNNALKEEVQIVFQLKGSEINKFKILKGEERLDIDIKPSKYAPTPTQLKKDKLTIINIHMNFWAALGAMIIFLTAFFTKNSILIILGTVMLLAGIAHIIFQYSRGDSTSIRSYNKGAECYNNGEFADAADYFDLAITQNPDNIFAQKGIKRLSGRPSVKKPSKRR